ncbi:PPE family protein [Williamsia herbipolensis]|uniref:PPE family protein n=1 Tax=Williamsia herbipolensis TaxID=1603258 RepID=A0AAU4K0F8_9NOCA|nr:PPE domain-containing protein [Williamsia herbipolensis]
MTGFTGIRWDARPAEQLSRDLSRGAGAKPLFEAGMSWAAIASALHELDREFAGVRKLMAEGWRGKGDAAMAQSLDKLSTWVSETADMAAHNATAAERQAVAHTVAMAAMPDAEVISALGQLEDALKAVAAPPHSLIAGGLAKLDEQAHGMKAQAARVMESYELATTPVATSWDSVPVPTHLVHRASLTAEKDKAAAKIAQQQALMGQGAMLAQIAAMSATPLGAYRSDEYVTQTRRDLARIDAAARADGEVVVQAANSGADGVVVDGQSAAQSQFVPATPMSAAAASAPGHQGQAPLPVTTNYASVQEAASAGSQVASPSVIGVPDGEGT